MKGKTKKERTKVRERMGIKRKGKKRGEMEGREENERGRKKRKRGKKGKKGNREDEKKVKRGN